MNTIKAIIYSHGENDFSYYGGFTLSDDDAKTIQDILNKYEHDGFSIRGTKQDIIEELEG